MVGGALLSYAGYRWWEAALPETVRNLFLGVEPALTALASTRSFTLWSLTVALIVGLVILVAAPRLARTVTALVMAVAAFAFFGGYERLREGTRKPFLIHSHMFSNGLLVSDIEAVNDEGILARSGWTARGADDSLTAGHHIFRAQCRSCHTLDGYQSIRKALPTYSDMAAVVADTDASVFASECAACHTDVSAAEMREMLPTATEMAEDPEMIYDLNQGMIYMAVSELHEMGLAYADIPQGQLIDTGAFRSSYMPPFVGTDEELEALVEYLVSLTRGDGAALAENGGVR
jgi:mono/diheme cytochrome c family protein